MSPEVPFIILIIAIITFFILRWILKRFIKNTKVLNWTSIAGSIILAPFLYVGLVIAFFGFLFYEPQYDFDREKWFDDKRKRFEMRDDIVKRNILIGKSKSEIIDFLGKPETGDSTDFWTYNLGMSGDGLGWQFNSLHLTFEEGRVSEVRKAEIVD